MLCQKYAWGVTALLIFATTAQAQDTMSATPDATIEALHAQSSQFLEGVSVGQAETAFAELLVGSPLSQQPEAVKKLVTSTRAIESRAGKYRDFERIESRRVGKDLVLMKYLYKCETFPVVWYFTYYRDFKRVEAMSDGENWVVIGVRFDTDLELLGF